MSDGFSDRQLEQLQELLTDAKTELRGDIRSAKHDLTEEIQLVRSDLSHEIQLVRDDLTREIQLVRSDLTQEIQLVRNDLAGVKLQLDRVTTMATEDTQELYREVSLLKDQVRKLELKVAKLSR